MTIILKRIPVLAGGAALAAALFLLPGGAARAQQDVCGASTASDTDHTCSAASYANGIWYDTQWSTPSGGDVTLRLPGSATTTTIATGTTAFTATSRDDESGIHIAVRGDITLIIGDATGGTPHPIQIEQRSGVPQTTPPVSGYGITLRQDNHADTENSEAVTVTLREGLTIGTATTVMLGGGVWTRINKASNTAAHSVTSAARIYATLEGIRFNHLGMGAATLDNKGDIDAGRYGLFLNMLNAASTGAATLTNSGAITVNSGVITVAAGVTSSLSDGIHIRKTGTGAVTVTNSGAITASEATSRGIHVNTNFAGTAAGEGAMSLTNSGVIRSGSHGVWAQHAGSGVMRFTNEGAITSSGATGVWLRHRGTGAVTVNNFGAVTGGGAGNGIDVEAEGDITIRNAADAKGANRGILARKTGAGTVSVSVTHWSGEVSGGTGEGIAAYVGSWMNEDPSHSGNLGADPTAPTGAADVKVSVTGGTVKGSETHGKAAVSAINYEHGSVGIDVSQGATLTSKNQAAIHAQLTDRRNAGGRIAVTQAGAISGEAAIYAVVDRGSATGETRAAAAQPLIDVAWTGTFALAERDAAPSNDDVPNAISRAQQHAARPWLRGAWPDAGIETEVIAYRRIIRTVTAGDDPGAIADAEEQAALVGEAPTSAAVKAAILTQFRYVLTVGTLGAIPGADDIDANDDDTYSDAELMAYLIVNSDARRVLLRDVLRTALSAKERAVMEALMTGGDLDAALDDADAAFSTEYKAAVRALAELHNVGNIRVAVDGGSIAAGHAGSDGIRAFYGMANDDNGAIDVIIAAGATVTGANAGVYVANAGVDAREAGAADDILKQTVTVNGMVTGGTDAAVHLAGGGALTVGETGRLMAGSSGRAILATGGRAEIVVHGLVRGGAGADAAIDLTGGGRVAIGGTGVVEAGGTAASAANAGADANHGGAQYAIRGDGEATSEVIAHADAAAFKSDAVAAFDRAVKGPMSGVRATVARVDANGNTTGATRPVDLDADGRPDFSRSTDLSDDPPPMKEKMEMVFSCEMAEDRCRLYEALPSVLLAMNGLPSLGERASAARDSRGAWARIEAANGTWKAADSEMAGLTYDHGRRGVRAGVDVALEGARLGVSMHGLRGSAEVASAGKIELSGVGLGASATRAFDGGFHVDVQAAATWYDADLRSTPGGRLKDGAKGLGYALGVEVGRLAATANGVSVTPRAGFSWSAVSLDAFTEEDNRVSVEDADSLVGRVGVTVATDADGGPRVFGSLDVTREFSEERAAMVSGTALKSRAEATGVRLGVGGAFDLGNGASLRGSADYTASGGDNGAYGVALSLVGRF